METWVLLRLFGRGRVSFSVAWSQFPLAQAVLICLVLGLVGITALIAPPNTWDSMTYHMPRVVHWIENQSLTHYPTHNTRQLYLQPWAEYAITHLQILTGSDRFANILQCFSMAGCAIGSSLVARLLGCTIQGQFLTALFTVTIPMGILQGSSTQNDLVVSFWLISFCYYCMRILILEDNQILTFAALFAALSLAFLTKGTAYIYALPFLTWLGLKRFRRRGLAGFIRLIAGGLIVLLLISGHFTRNIATFGNPGGPIARTVNWDFGLRLLASSIARNLALHFVTPSDFINQGVETAVVGFHQWMDLSANPPDTTYPNTEFHIPSSRWLAPGSGAKDNFDIILHEDLAGNLVHTLLMIVVALFCLLSTEVRRNRTTICYLFSCGTAFLLFCLFLRWQPWASRLHLPVFVLCSALFGLVSVKILSQKGQFIIIAFLFVMALPWLFLNTSRPLLGPRNIFQVARAEQYLSNRPKTYSAYRRVASVAGQLRCSQIGLIMNGDSGEYPLWIYLEEELDNSFRLEQIQVRNVSAKYANSLFSPCVIIALDPPLTDVSYGNQVFHEIYRADPLSVLK